MKRTTINELQSQVARINSNRESNKLELGFRSGFIAIDIVHPTKQDCTLDTLFCGSKREVSIYLHGLEERRMD